MKKLLKTIRSRKGISIIEVVVAMAIVMIVSAAALSLMVTSVEFDRKYDAQTQAMNACESAVECIRFANTADELDGYLSRLGFEKAGEEYILPDNDTVKIRVNGNQWILIFEGKDVYAKDFPEI